MRISPKQFYNCRIVVNDNMTMTIFYLTIIYKFIQQIYNSYKPEYELGLETTIIIQINLSLS